MKHEKFCFVILAMLGVWSIQHIGVFSTAAIAQTYGKRWGGGFAIGANQLYSDLPKTGYGLGFEARLARRLGARTGLTLGLGYGSLPFSNPKLTVDEKKYQLYKGNFKTNFFQVGAIFDYELIAASNFRPYLALGVSAINFQMPFQVKANNQGNPTVDLSKHDRFNDGALLAGGGLRVMLGPRLALDLGGNFRYTTGDEFDMTKIKTSRDGIITVMAGLTFFGGGGTDILAEQAPVEETEASDLSEFDERIGQLETSSQQPQDMQEYIRLKSRMDELNQQIEQKENEISTLQAAVVEKKSSVESLETKVASIPSAGSSVSFSRAYEDALSKFYAKRYQEAIQQFSSLLAQFPDHSLVSNCAYWIGESYFGAGNYREAIDAFNRVLTYPRSLKKDDALLMLGRAHLQLNEREEARQAFNRLIQDYPSSEFIAKAQEWLSKI